jgi:hypothetical protein
VSPVNVRDPGEIEQAVTAFAHTPNGGIIVPGSALAVVNRNLIVTLAAQHKPARDLLHAILRHRWRLDLLRDRYDQPVSARGRLR